MKRLACLKAVTILCLLRGAGAQTPAIPSQYQDAYNDVNASIQSAASTIAATWDGSSYPVLRSSVLQTASSDLTTSLLNPGYYQGAVLAELNALQALGVKAVTIQINYPVLYEPYYSDPSQYQAFLAFYTQLISDVHARGLKLIVENTSSVPYPGTGAASFAPYFQALDWPTYQTQRAQLAASIAQLVQPDYLVLLEEPDTEASVTGQTNVNTVAGATQMLQGMIAAVQATKVTNVKLSAGCGTWNPNFLQFVQSFATLPIPYIDMHVYPVNQNNLPNALAAIGLIQTAGKQATMSEMWVYKESNTDYTSNLPYTTVFARDVFSFWGSTDVAFLRLMSDMTNYGHFAFASPFWSHYLSAYLDYDTYTGLPDTTLIADETTAVSQAVSAGAFTPTGNAFENMLIGAPDQTPPTQPAAPVSQGASQTAAIVTWAPATDNVGVAAYNVYRDKALVATVNSPLSFTDVSLSPDTTYSYTVQAFDASNNFSARSAPVTITTYPVPDKTAPSTPSQLRAAAVSDTQVSLTWNASTDNTAVVGYEIYRGADASSITPLSSSPVNSFVDPYGAPNGTYYYQIDAYDAAGNHSSRSSVATATFLADTSPPTVPANVSLTTSPGPTITVRWSASTDDYYLGEYEILRGTAANNLAVLAVTGPSPLSFADSKIIPGRTYYYSVAAVDEAGNVSGTQTPVAIVAFPDTIPPTVPENFETAVVSATTVNLTWTPSADNVGVYGYEIYRGTVSSDTEPIGTSPIASYSDTTAAPGQTYYYQIDAYDTSNNHSAKSVAVIASTPPDTTPPTAPATTSAMATSGPAITLSWSASTDNYWVGTYQVLRGTDPSNLSLCDIQAATSLTFTDLRVISGSTYYYAVVGVDVAGNMSALSPIASATAP